MSDFERNSFDFLRNQKKEFLKDSDIVFDETYLSIRNKICGLYNATYKFVSLTEAYNEVKGSFKIVSKVHSFLVRQKIINNRNVLKECQEMVESLYKAQEPTIESLNVLHQDKPSGKVTKRDLTTLADLNKNCVCEQKAP